MLASANWLSLKVNEGRREDVVDCHEYSSCPIVRKVVRQEDHHEAIKEHGNDGSHKHSDGESSDLPAMSEPVAEPEEQEKNEYTNKRDAYSELVAEVLVPGKEHSPEDNQAEGDHEHIEQPEDWQDVHLERYF